MTVYAGYNVTIYTTGTATAMTNESCTETGASTDLWEIDDSAKDIWDTDATFTVEESQDGGSSWTTVSASDYTLKYLLGQVDLSAYASAGSVTDVRVSGDYLPKGEVTTARGLNYVRSIADLDSATFADTANQRTAGLFDVSGSVEALDDGLTAIASKTMNARVDDGDNYVIAVDAATAEHRAWIRWVTDEVTSSPDDLVVETLNYVGSTRDPAMTSQSASLFDQK